jgi:hypothetical protein
MQILFVLKHVGLLILHKNKYLAVFNANNVNGF